MEKVYVVIGESGEYDSYYKWSIVAYLDRGKAEEHKRNANNRGKEITDLVFNQGYDDDSLSNEYDPDMLDNMEYNGATYSIEEVELKK